MFLFSCRSLITERFSGENFLFRSSSSSGRKKIVLRQRGVLIVD